MHIAWNQFTPYSALIGGILIGTSAVVLLLCLGRIAGVSGMVANLLKLGQGIKPQKQDWTWQLSFVMGLLLSSWLYILISPQLSLPLPSIQLSGNWFHLIIAGLFVGVGTVYGSGCTSGHGVCGISRLSIRSIAATVIFMFAGFLTVYVVRNLLS